LTEPFFAVWLILSGAMQGAAATRGPMVATVLCFNGLRLGAAWMLSISCDLGAHGTWIAMAVSTVAAGLMMMWQWRRLEFSSTKTLDGRRLQRTSVLKSYP